MAAGACPTKQVVARALAHPPATMAAVGCHIGSHAHDRKLEFAENSPKLVRPPMIPYYGCIHMRPTVVYVEQTNELTSLLGCVIYTPKFSWCINLCIQRFASLHRLGTRAYISIFLSCFCASRSLALSLSLIHHARVQGAR